MCPGVSSKSVIAVFHEGASEIYCQASWIGGHIIAIDLRNIQPGTKCSKLKEHPSKSKDECSRINS
jgi:hypothetical protein